MTKYLFFYAFILSGFFVKADNYPIGLPRGEYTFDNKITHKKEAKNRPDRLFNISKAKHVFPVKKELKLWHKILLTTGITIVMSFLVLICIALAVAAPALELYALAFLSGILGIAFIVGYIFSLLAIWTKRGIRKKNRIDGRHRKETTN